ncbi:MAG: radical SAM family heme chaperone HemW [Marinilabiliales bacterium]|nr:radical SAM family heme chaperone HemW [Marinilabiliales bacterium]
MAGIYIHIPFCEHKCLYCDFFSGNQLYLMDDYVEAVAKELKLRADYLHHEFVETIYFGGGTPSLLNKEQILWLKNAIVKAFPVKDTVEFTLECNPENINTLYVKDLIEIGVNRISLGIQFLNNERLSYFNRNHTRELILQSLDVLEKLNFPNISVDFIFNVPGIDSEELIKDLKFILKYPIKHISTYSLTVSEGSKLYWLRDKGVFHESSEEDFENHYTSVLDLMANYGYRQYEISNFAKSGYESIHNSNYWRNGIYLGAGVSAHSYDGNTRQWNHKNIKKYIRDLENDRMEFEKETLSTDQKLNEYLLFKLRTFDPIDFEWITNNFGDHYSRLLRKKVNELYQDGYFVRENENFRCSQKEFMVSDYLAKQLFF